MAQKGNSTNNIPNWYTYLAASNVIIAVLAGIASLQAGTFSSNILIEKNNSILYQNQANKEWNHYLASDITSQILQREDQGKLAFQSKAEDLEKKVEIANKKSDIYFQKTSDMSMAGTMLEIAIALSAISILVKRKFFWHIALVLAAIGTYFLVIGLF